MSFNPYINQRLNATMLRPNPWAWSTGNRFELTDYGRDFDNFMIGGVLSPYMRDAWSPGRPQPRTMQRRPGLDPSAAAFIPRPSGLNPYAPVFAPRY
jgi:hypothetical protein